LSGVIVRRICIGFTNIIGYGTSLRDGFREIGEDARCYIFGNDNYNRGEPDHDILIDMYNILYCSIQPKVKFRFLKIPFIVLSEAIILLFYFLAPFRFDVFVFLSESKHQRLVLWWIKHFIGRKIFFVFFGSDIRPAKLDGALLNLLPPNEIQGFMQKQKRLVDSVEKYCDYIISHPPISMFQTRPFFQYIKIGVPTPTQSAAREYRNDTDVTRILHAPTSKGAKGSPEIRRLIEKMINNGHKILYLELYGLPHADVIREMLLADIVIDQLYTDIPVSGTTLDGCACGVPVIGGTYYDFGEYNLIPGVDYPDCILCHPNNLMYELDRMITERNINMAVGLRALEFVSTKWNNAAIAYKYIQILSCRAKQDWIYVPSENTQIYGCGVKK